MARRATVLDAAAVAGEESRSIKAGIPLARKLGAAITAKRRLLDISQEELAARAGLHRTYLTSVEGGKRNPSLVAIAQIASGLGIPISELFRLMEAMTEGPTPPRRARS